MKNKLRYIYSIQQIDVRLDELEEYKGDLPQEVARLRSEIALREQSLAQFHTSITKAMIDRDTTDVEIVSLKEKTETYRTQQLQVKTNKQYDALTKEIETSQTRIQKLEKDFLALEANANIAKVDGEKLSEELPALREELETKEKELKSVSSEYQHEEDALKQERAKIFAELDEADVDKYERIRKAKGGKAVALILIREQGKTKKVKEGTCGGCYHRIPPERIVELRQLERMYSCEHCGRILIPSEAIESVEQPVLS